MVTVTGGTFVGDALVDFKTAEDTGANFCAMLCGPMSARVFLEAGLPAERIWNGFDELLKLL